MSDDLHDCPAPGCQRRIAFDQMTCRPHWWALPGNLRSAISRAWKTGDLQETLRLREKVEQTLGER